MHHRMFLLIAVLPLLGGGCVLMPDCSIPPSEPPPLSGEVSLLDALDTVEASGVGAGGSPGRFHTLAKQFLAKGTPADFERLANDKVPLTRAMGLYCLARSKGNRAVPVLQAHLNDDWPVNVTIGCIAGRETIGQFAGHLLRNRNYLEFKDPDPLLPAAQVFVTDVLRLASDKPYEIDGGDGDRRDLLYLVSDQLERKQVTLDAAGFAAVLKYLPANEPRWGLVKGMGRAISSKPRDGSLGEGEVEPDTVIRDFLIKRLRDRSEDSKTRLASASALTRVGDDASAAALRAEAMFLSESQAGLADRLLAAVALRKTLARWVEQTNPMNLLGGKKSPAPPAELAATDHPMVLEYIERNSRKRESGGGGGGLFLAPDSPNVNLADGQLARLAKRIGEFGHAWDTYSDAVWELERMSASEMSTTGAIDGEIVSIRRDIARAIRARE